MTRRGRVALGPDECRMIDIHTPLRRVLHRFATTGESDDRGGLR
jgi:hypothetical protein